MSPLTLSDLWAHHCLWKDWRVNSYVHHHHQANLQRTQKCAAMESCGDSIRPGQGFQVGPGCEHRHVFHSYSQCFVIKHICLSGCHLRGLFISEYRGEQYCDKKCSASLWNQPPLTVWAVLCRPLASLRASIRGVSLGISLMQSSLMMACPPSVLMILFVYPAAFQR